MSYTDSFFRNSPSPWVIAKRLCPQMLAHALRDHDREDINQECYLRIRAAEPRYDPNRGASFATFAGWQILAVVSQLARKVRRRKATEWDQNRGNETPEDRDPDQTTFQVWFDSDFTRRRSTLSVRNRVILYLRAVEGWDFRSIAKCFGLTYQRVAQVMEAIVSHVRGDPPPPPEEVCEWRREGRSGTAYWRGKQRLGVVRMVAGGYACRLESWPPDRPDVWVDTLCKAKYYVKRESQREDSGRVPA